VDRDQLCATQAPLKDRYPDAPQAALVYQTLASGAALATSVTTR
jgi:hypothetical protein